MSTRGWLAALLLLAGPGASPTPHGDGGAFQGWPVGRPLPSPTTLDCGALLSRDEVECACGTTLPVWQIEARGASGNFPTCSVHAGRRETEMPFSFGVSRPMYGAAALDDFNTADVKVPLPGFGEKAFRSTWSSDDGRFHRRGLGFAVGDEIVLFSDAARDQQAFVCSDPDVLPALAARVRERMLGRTPAPCVRPSPSPTPSILPATPSPTPEPGTWEWLRSLPYDQGVAAEKRLRAEQAAKVPTDPPAAVPELSDSFRRRLSKLGCRIAKQNVLEAGDKEVRSHFVGTAHLTAPDQSDQFVVCIQGARSALVVGWGGAAACPEIAADFEPNDRWIVPDLPNGASPRFERVPEAVQPGVDYDSQILEALGLASRDHDVLLDPRGELADDVLYCDHGKWKKGGLQGD